LADTHYYTNAAGNKYRIDELKYFISSVSLYREDGSKTVLTQDQGIHYIDMDYPQTLTWDLFQNIAEGKYNAVGFTFGLNEIDNQSYRFPNPPEANMGWSQALGGGYHYMMLNGWFYQNASLSPLNIHLGKGQIYRGTDLNADSIIGFVDNHFHVLLPASFVVKRSETAQLNLVMNIENWFQDPWIYDFNYWGGHIMQKQGAMQMLKENGRNVFTAE
jgi:hypothetical protein